MARGYRIFRKNPSFFFSLKKVKQIYGLFKIPNNYKNAPKYKLQKKKKIYDAYIYIN